MGAHALLARPTLLGIGALSLLWSGALRAQPAEPKTPRSIWLRIDRVPGSESCPDVARVMEAIQRLFPNAGFEQHDGVSGANASATVVVRPGAVGHEAIVRVEAPHPGERLIVEQDPQCGGLADALAVTLVMLVDPDARPAGPVGATDHPDAELSEREPTPAAVVTAPPPTTKSPTVSKAPSPVLPSAQPRVATPPPEKPWCVGVDGGANLAVGLLSKPSLGAAVGLWANHGAGWGLSLRGLRTWAAEAGDERGSIDLDLWAAMGGPCFQHALTEASGLRSCLVMGAGVQHASVEGYRERSPKSRPWLVAGPEVRFEQGLGWRLSGFVGVGLFGHLVPNSFSVEGVGVVAKAPGVGVYLDLGISAAVMGENAPTRTR